MNKSFFPLLMILVMLAGCIEFGDDEVTTSPTKVQVDRCRLEMYLKPSADIVPVGYMLSGSGIDDAIWFKFKTNSEDLAELFDTKVVDVSKFKNGYSLYEMDELKWWNVKDKKLFGGQVSLPNVRYMNVGTEKIEEGYLVYIMWHET